jgi:hypothetical protein
MMRRAPSASKTAERLVRVVIRAGLQRPEPLQATTDGAGI